MRCGRVARRDRSRPSERRVRRPRHRASRVGSRLARARPRVSRARRSFVRSSVTTDGSRAWMMDEVMRGDVVYRFRTPTLRYRIPYTTTLRYRIPYIEAGVRHRSIDRVGESGESVGRGTSRDAGSRRSMRRRATGGAEWRGGRRESRATRTHCRVVAFVSMIIVTTFIYTHALEAAARARV